MNALETRLRAWRLRQPSATLEWRLLAARIATLPRLIRVAGWLTPITVCGLLALLAVNSETALAPAGPRPLPITAMLSNQSCAVYATSQQSRQNNLSVFTFDWTNQSGSGSNLRFTSFPKPTD